MNLIGWRGCSWICCSRNAAVQVVFPFLPRKKPLIVSLRLPARASERHRWFSLCGDRRTQVRHTGQGRTWELKKLLLTLWALDGQGTETEDFHAGAHFSLFCSLAISWMVTYLSHSSLFLYFRWHFAYGQSAWQSWKKEPHSLLTKWMTRYCENPFW